METMDNPSFNVPPKDADEAQSDQARRLAGYRRRVEAEGRPRSVRLIDRTIVDAGRKSERDL